MVNFLKIDENLYKTIVFKDTSKFDQNMLKTNYSLQDITAFSHQDQIFSMGIGRVLKNANNNKQTF